MNRLLITGPSGFIGAHCLRLIAQGTAYSEIHAINRGGEGPGEGTSFCMLLISAALKRPRVS
jgi:uncharacterized protein YbjT (DUF2867 family)